MKLATLAMIGAVSVAATAMEAVNATPLPPGVVAQAAPEIVQVWGGCGPGWRPTWRGCVPDRRWRSRNWRRRW